jgi:hypothetical protein
MFCVEIIVRVFLLVTAREKFYFYNKHTMISRAKTKVTNNVLPKKKVATFTEPNLEDMIAKRDYTGAIAVLEVSNG